LLLLVIFGAVFTRLEKNIIIIHLHPVSLLLLVIFGAVFTRVEKESSSSFIYYSALVTTTIIIHLSYCSSESQAVQVKNAFLYSIMIFVLIQAPCQKLVVDLLAAGVPKLVQYSVPHLIPFKLYQESLYICAIYYHYTCCFSVCNYFEHFGTI
jgi:hypothetical protein